MTSNYLVVTEEPFGGNTQRIKIFSEEIQARDYINELKEKYNLYAIMIIFYNS